MGKLKTLLIIAAALPATLTLSQQSWAQWQKQDEAPAHFDEYQVDMRINRDFTVEATEDFTAVIDKESAIKDFSIIAENYVPETDQLKILSAQTINNDKISNLDPRFAQDKAIASQQPGYDSIHEVRLSLPQISVGTKLHVRLWRKSHPQPFPNFISEMIKFDERYPVRSYKFKLDSALPIAYKLFDPRHQLNFGESKTGTGLKLEAKSTGAIYQRVSNETYGVFTDPQAPILFISSGTEWAAYGNQIATEYEKVLHDPLPVEFQKIADTAKQKKDPFDQVEAVLSALQKSIHYIGSWQTVHGKYFSRTLAEIATSRFGDCKDYTVSAAAILRKLGFEALPAWTYLDAGYSSPNELSEKQPRLVGFKPPLPGLYFNHAIVKLAIDHKEYWLDPTSPISYARGVAPEFAGAYALVLNPKGSTMDSIPFPGPEDNFTETTTYVALNGDKTSDQLSRSKLRGYLGALVNYQKAEAKMNSSHELRSLLDRLTGVDQAKKEPQSSSEATVEMGQSGIDLSGSTSAGAGINFGFNRTLLPYAVDQSQTVGSVLIYTPGRVLQTTIIEGGSLLGDVPAPCKIDNPWVSATRTFDRSGEDVKVIEDITVKKSLIANAELHGADFKQMQETLKNCWKETTLVFQPNAANDPNHSFAYVEPWTWTEWQIKRYTLQKFLGDTLSSIKNLIGFKQDRSNVKSLDPMPEWTKGKSLEDIKKNLWAFLDKVRDENIGLVATKFVLLDLARSYPRDPEIDGFLSRTEYKLAYIKNSEYDAKALERSKYYAYRALEIDPFHPLAHRMLAWYLIASRDAKFLIKQASFAVSLDRNSPHAGALAEKVEYLRGDYQKALQIATELEDYDGQINVYMTMKQYDDVEKTYEKQVQAEPHPWTYLNYASYLTQMQRKPDKAIELAKKSLELGETGMGHWVLSEAYSFKASELARDKKTSDAIGFYQMALAEKNDNASVHSGLGIVLSILGKEQRNPDLLAQAREHLEVAEKLDPDNFKERATLSSVKETITALASQPQSGNALKRSPAALPTIQH